MKNIYFVYYEVHIWCTLEERKQGKKNEPKKQTNEGKKNIPVHEPADIQITDTWTKYFSFLHNVNFLSERLIYTEDR
jgi:hypothetical protein